MRELIFIFFFLLQSFFCFSQQKANVTVYFRFDKYDVDSIYRTKIDSAMQRHNIVKVDIKAHCDSFGTNPYNDALSLKRADAVKEYVISRGPKESNIDVKGFGKRFPLNGNENAKARALNRRAEIVFTMEDPLHTKTDSVPRKVIVPKEEDDATSLPDTSTISLKNVEVGKTFVLENLNFYGGRHVLLPRSQKPLRVLLNTLKANPTLEIEIQGHICCMRTGDGLDIDTGTLDLSVNRAKTIYDYLVKSGIDPARLSYRGFGSSHKLVIEFTDADRTTNRRVEIKVLKK